MKKNNLLLIILVLFLIKTSLAQVSGWVWQNPLPQGDDMTKICFTSSDTGYQIGYWTSIYKTTNSGNNWYSVLENSTYNLGAICFVNNTTGIVTGANYYLPGDGIVLKTTNGGLNWVKTPFDTTKILLRISFGNQNTGYGTGFPNVIYKTTNCGGNWFTTNTPGNIYYVYFLDDMNGYFAGEGNKIYKTTDGCSSFTTTVIPNASIVSIRFLNSNTGIAIGNSNTGSSILRTTDAGLNWLKIDSVVTKKFQEIQFVDSQKGFITCYNNSNGTTSVFSTLNSGMSWNEIYSNQISYNSFCFSTPDKGFLISYGGKILRTTNGGTNWFDYNTITYTSLMKVQFVNESKGYIAAASGSFLSTTDGGNNWSLKIIDSTVIFKAMHFVDENNGFISGFSGQYPIYSNSMFKTSDGGLNWSQITYNHLTNSIFFVNTNTGYAAGYSGVISKTTNAGATWIDLPTGVSVIFNYISFTNDNTGFACGTQGIILKTTNAGSNWINKFGAPQNTVTNINFPNQNTGFAISFDPDWSYNRIWKTTDNGENWSLKYTTYDDLNSVFFPEAATGYIAGSTGVFLKTTNNGENWFKPTQFTGRTLLSVYFTNANTGYVVGDNGTILKTTNSGSLLSIKEIDKVIPKHFMLSQNYPNPFNPTTNIKFDLPKSGLVRLIIYDVLGREVSTLVNSELKAGSYNADWDASNYSSGVYFYKLETADFVETKKMVLIK